MDRTKREIDINPIAHEIVTLAHCFSNSGTEEMEEEEEVTAESVAPLSKWLPSKSLFDASRELIPSFAAASFNSPKSVFTDSVFSSSFAPTANVVPFVTPAP